MVTRVGGRLPVHATGVGLVLLAHAPVEVQDRVLAASLARYTRHTITDPRRLRRILADVRRDGFAVSDRQIETISASVAAPVRDRTDRVVAAVSLVFPARRRCPPSCSRRTSDRARHLAPVAGNRLDHPAELKDPFVLSVCFMT